LQKNSESSAFVKRRTTRRGGVSLEGLHKTDREDKRSLPWDSICNIAKSSKKLENGLHATVQFNPILKELLESSYNLWMKKVKTHVTNLVIVRIVFEDKFGIYTQRGYWKWSGNCQERLKNLRRNWSSKIMLKIVNLNVWVSRFMSFSYPRCMIILYYLGDLWYQYG